MWGNFAKLAERAATAAEAIESQMNDSVGAPKPKPRPTSIATTSYSDSYNNLPMPFKFNRLYKLLSLFEISKTFYV